MKDKIKMPIMNHFKMVLRILFIVKYFCQNKVKMELYASQPRQLFKPSGILGESL
jgi:hypothetical protein